MDAVKTYVEGIGGQITIETKIDYGSSFHLKVTTWDVCHTSYSCTELIISYLLLQRLMFVKLARCQSTIFISMVKSVFTIGMACFIPCYDVDDFIYQDFKTEPLSTKVERVSLCLIDSDQGLIALRVQELISNVEIVTKSLPPMAYQLPYVTGISIMATGEPTFVVSLKLLYQRVIKTRELPDKELMYGAA
jgi:two-component system chemotaxis sensor kinase CheA